MLFSHSVSNSFKITREFFVITSSENDIQLLNGLWHLLDIRPDIKYFRLFSYRLVRGKTRDNLLCTYIKNLYGTLFIVITRCFDCRNSGARLSLSFSYKVKFYKQKRQEIFVILICKIYTWVRKSGIYVIFSKKFAWNRNLNPKAMCVLHCDINISHPL